MAEVSVQVTGRDGAQRELRTAAGQPLMDVLRDAGCGTEGICGGMMSCGTCHVYVAESWQARLAPRSEDEQMMLEALGDLVPLRPGSRLACQINLAAALDGLVVEIAPAA